MNKISYFLIFLSFISVTYAQNTLTGKVTDEHGSALIGVDIYSEDLQKGSSSDENGNFIIKNIPNGEHIFIFMFMGYETQKKIITFFDENKTVDVKLFETVFHMDEVIVSTPFNKLQSQNVMKVEHKSIESLEKKGGSTLVESISNIAGVSNISTGTGIGKPVIRGLSGNRVLTYTQGVRLENYQNGEKHGLGVNESGIEAIEVIKGPASLLYGSDALGGVLYLIPEKFALNNTTNGDIAGKYFSNTLGFNTIVGAKSSGDKFKFLVRGAYDAHSDYKTGDNQRVTNSRFNEADVKVGLGYSNNDFTSDLRYNYNQSQIGIPKEIGKQETSKKLSGLHQDLDYHIVSLKNDFVLKSSSVKTNLGYTHNNRKLINNNKVAVDMLLSTFNYDAKWYLPEYGKFETVIGVQGMVQTNRNNGVQVFLPDANINDIGVFGNLNYNWDSSAMQAGIRFDNRKIDTEEHGIFGEEHFIEAIDRSLNSFSGSIGYKTDINQNLVTRINFASGFRAPNLSEFASNGIHEGRWEIGNSNLENEQNMQLDLSLEYKAKHFEFFINSFYNNIYDYIFIAPTGNEMDDFEVYTYVQNDAYLYGGEVGVHLHPHPIDWLHFESMFEMVVGKQKGGGYLPRIPANKIDNTFRAEFDVDQWLDFGYVYLNMESTFKQNKVSDFEDRSKSYSLLNFGLGGNVKINKMKTNINFTVNNILNKEYMSHLSVLNEEGILNQGINFVFGLKFNY
ncbi:MAG: TonB-dependent receptor [Bacteroidota bacterium]